MTDVAAAEECVPWVAKIVSVEGTIEARSAEQVTWQPAAVGDTYCPGDSLRVPQWRAAIVLGNETIIRLDQGTIITFTKFAEEKPLWLDVIRGIIHFMSRIPRRLNVTTPFFNAAVEGTEFVVRVDENETTLWTFEGQVRVSNDFGSLTLVSGQAAVAKAGEAPLRRIVVQPREAVQWALYYPPLTDFRAVALVGPNAKIIQDALELYRRGDLLGALTQLEAVPADRRDAQFFTLRAGLLLSVGRVEKAGADIEEALRLDPDNGIAVALQSVIAVVQNEKETALRLARQAAERAPESPVPQIALSYAYQAAFEIEQALASAQEATRLAPEDSLAWARVAELWLSRGYLDRALEAAETAVALNPNLARTQTVLGFARLTQQSLIRLNRAEARAAFEKAIKLDPADPLPHLGLGLTKINESHLAEGRREIEIATSLDPNNALIRSYLGKAYFEEKRDPLAASQLEIAKELDPRDPTPWFYDAIRKQLVNRPVEALHDLQKSIELNHNRAVYRSRLLLDEDQAARSATIGRTYRDLGFEQRALVEGWHSLTTDPASHSAHRLLADSYAALPRHGIARVSELLQAQLLQPLNTNNLQPQLAETNLQILEAAGPSALSFNEFNPLFVRDGVRVLANGVLGNNDTGGIDGVLSGIQGPLSYSLGGFHFDTDGFRANNDLKHDIYNVFVQGTITPRLNVQAEFRSRQTDKGDLQLRFDPNDFEANRRENVDQDTVRVGTRFSPWPHSDLIVSLLASKREEIENRPDISPSIGGVRARGMDDAHQGEVQYLYRHDWFNAVIGAGTYDIDVETQIQGILVPIVIEDTKAEVNHDTYYAYVNAELPTNLTWTGGLAYDSLDEVGLDVIRVSPKVGIQWNPTDWARLRLAYLQAVKRALVVEQTIEPTQVAGFNQFFDDRNGTETTRYGVGLDAVLSQNLYGGVEYSQRELEVPRLLDSRATKFDRREELYRAYFYWTPHREWAVSTEVEFEQFDRSLETSDQTEPTAVNTLTLPLAVRYFNPSGLFARVIGTFVRQDIDPVPTSTLTRDSDEFFLVDAAIGFRLPNRTGIISLEARNLFDQDFFFQDENIQTTDPVNPRFLPTRTVLGQVTFSF